MSQQLYFGMNGQPLNSNNYGNAVSDRPVIQRKPNIPNIDDTPKMNIIQNDNKVSLPTDNDKKVCIC